MSRPRRTKLAASKHGSASVGAGPARDGLGAALQREPRFPADRGRADGRPDDDLLQGVPAVRAVHRRLHLDSFGPQPGEALLRRPYRSRALPLPLVGRGDAAKPTPIRGSRGWGWVAG